MRHLLPSCIEEEFFERQAYAHPTPASPWLTQRAPLAAQSTIRMGSGTILSLVEDALNVGFEGTGQFTVTPVLCNPRLEVLERSWSVVNLQKRYAEKVRSIKMTIDIAPNVPEMSLLDASRACQVLTNLVRSTSREHGESRGQRLAAARPLHSFRALEQQQHISRAMRHCESSIPCPSAARQCSEIRSRPDGLCDHVVHLLQRGRDAALRSPRQWQGTQP